MKPVLLIGPRAAGKSSVAQSLAEALVVQWVDLDELVLRTLSAESAKAAFAELGEAAWRSAESTALKSILDDPPPITATGGGVVCDVINRERLAAADHVQVIWLDVSPEVSRDRLRETAGDRPSLTGQGDAAEEAIAVARSRRGLYEQVAGDRVDADGSIADVTQAVREMITHV